MALAVMNEFIEKLIKQGTSEKILQVLNSIEKKGGLKALAIGGSAGSFKTVISILKTFSLRTTFPVFLCLHRLRNRSKGFQEVLSLYSKLKVIEPDDKEKITGGKVYIAPSNYHLLVEKIGEEEYVSLDAAELIQYSRPSIDVMFESLGDVYGENLLTILLSGANRDGTRGTYWVHKQGGTTVAEHTLEHSIAIMPNSAIETGSVNFVLEKKEILDLITALKIFNTN